MAHLTLTYIIRKPFVDWSKKEQALVLNKLNSAHGAEDYVPELARVATQLPAEILLMWFENHMKRLKTYIDYCDFALSEDPKLQLKDLPGLDQLNQLVVSPQSYNEIRTTLEHYIQNIQDTLGSLPSTLGESQTLIQILQAAGIACAQKQIELSRQKEKSHAH